MLGWAADGFPIYGPRGPGGVLMKRCSLSTADPNACVDECGGMEGDYIDDGFMYRYYMLGEYSDGHWCGGPASEIGDYKKVFGSHDDANAPPNNDFYPNSPVCYKGCCPAGVQCSAKFLPQCSTTAKEGITRAPVAEHASGLANNTDACW